MFFANMLSELIKSAMKARPSETVIDRAIRIGTIMALTCLIFALMLMTNRSMILSEQNTELRIKYEKLLEEQSKNQNGASSDRGNGLVPKGFWQTEHTPASVLYSSGQSRGR